MNRTALYTGLGCVLLGASAAVGAATVYGVDAYNQLVRFNSASPDAVTSIGAISGLAYGESIVGMDFRPATNDLYALGSSNQVYVIDPATGAATAVGGAGQFTLSGTSFGFDFNPTVDRIRVVSDVEQNIRLDPGTGGLAATDPGLAYAAGDSSFGINPNIVGSAYTNNFDNPGGFTQLYGIDSGTDRVVLQQPANQGGLLTLFSLGVDTSDAVGFDIAPTSAGGNLLVLASLTTADGTGLYQFDLLAGLVSYVGLIGDGSTLTDIAIAPVPIPAAAWLLGSGVMGLVAFRRRRRVQ